MLAEQSLQEGRLDEALAQLQEDVRRDPANAKHRIFLFQLLALIGSWDRALNQLAVVGEVDPTAEDMVQTYRPALQCELLRAEIFAGKRSPLVFGEPEPWIAHLVEALRLGSGGENSRAKELREKAFEAAPAVPGSIDESSFEWVADADARLGPILEAIVNGRYYWIPFHRIRDIRLDPPVDLRDLVWMPASFTWTNGGEAVGLIPTRYPGSEAHADGGIRMARRTDWMQVDETGYRGVGQRVLTTDTDDFALLDVRHVHLDAPTGADPGRPPGGSTPS